ncbi:hypothetical protein ABC733_14605 [Mangrovibacter sp. SLW1]
MPREKRDFNRISGVKDPSLIVIACEGEKQNNNISIVYLNGVMS